MEDVRAVAGQIFFVLFGGCRFFSRHIVLAPVSSQEKSGTMSQVNVSNR
jgi:hypothetical protein